MTTKLDAKMDAINSLSPGLAFHLSPDGVASLANIDGQENKGVIPSEDEIQAEITRLQTEHDSKEYSRNRRKEYPEIGDQLDMLWHGMDDGTLTKVDSFYNAIKTVKDKYSKE